MFEDECRDRWMEAILHRVRQAWYLYAAVFNGKRRQEVLFVEMEGGSSNLPEAPSSLGTPLIPSRDRLERHLEADVIFRQHLRAR